MPGHAFSDSEGVRIAVEIERRGGDFYRRAAKITKDERARAFLSELAADEEAHMREFSKLCERIGAQGDQAYSAEESAYLSAVAADVVFTGGLRGLARTGLESPRAILEHSIQAEKDSILFYGEMAALTRDEQARALFRDIIAQEKMHLSRLQRMLNEQSGKDDEQ